MEEAVPGNVPVSHAGKSKSHEFRIGILILRALLLALAITSFVLMVTDSQTSTVPLPFIALPQPIYITKTAKYELITGLKFYVDALGIVIGATVLHLLFNIGLLVTKGTVVDRKLIAWISFIADSAMAYLIMSAAAVGTEIGYLAERGANSILWNKVCNHFGYFCTIYAVSLSMCFLASLVSFTLVGISAYHLFRLYGINQALKDQNINTATSAKDSVP